MPISTKMARAKAEAVYWDNYVKYLDSVDERGSGVGKGKPRPESTILHVLPFSVSLPAAAAGGATTLLKASGNAATWNTHKGKWKVASIDYARDSFGDDPATEISVAFKFREARVSITTGLLTAGVRKVAKGTKKPYLSYNGPSTVTTSLPFGRPIGATGAGANITENAVFEILASQFQVNGKLPTGQKITHIKEKG